MSLQNILLKRLHSEEEIVIEDDSRTLAVFILQGHYAAPSPNGIALAKAHEQEGGDVRVLDPDFAADMQEIIEHRHTWNPPF